MLCFSIEDFMNQPEPNKVPVLMTARVVRDHFGLSHSTINRLIVNGEVERIHLGRSSLIYSESVVAYLDRKREPKSGVAQ
jgi:hypothetical protein